MKNDPRSYDRNFCNCVKKPEKKFRTSTGLHIFHGNIWTQNWPAPNVSGFIAQLVERRTGIARSRVQAPLKSWIFFGLLYAIAKIAIITARIILHLDLLLAKLAAYGLSSNVCSLIRYYLTDRFQRVRLGDKFSDWNPLSRGIPQRFVNICFLAIYYLLGFNPSSVHMLMIHKFLIPVIIFPNCICVCRQISLLLIHGFALMV